MGAAITNYQSFDAAPQKGDNLYRLTIISNNGQASYSSVINVTNGEEIQGVQIALCPNPVRKDDNVNLQLTNLAAGIYLASVYSGDGQTVYQKQINIAQSNATQSETLIIGSSLAAGSYPIRLTDSKGATVYTDKLIVGR